VKAAKDVEPPKTDIAKSDTVSETPKNEIRPVELPVKAEVAKDVEVITEPVATDRVVGTEKPKGKPSQMFFPVFKPTGPSEKAMLVCSS
jgi:hypothetical protein